MTPRHLYVHVPFCGRRCVYCDFSIAVRRVTPVAEYLGALEVELAAVRPHGAWALETLYLGGGTPSRLGAAGIAALIEMVRRYATLDETAEVTIEANPEDVNDADARGWLAAGVNRVSLGVQSFNDEVLQWMRRAHTGEQSAEAIRTLRAAGIENISADLIFALPETLRRVWREDLTRVIALGPPHISIYGLTVEPSTPLARWVTAGAVRASGEDPYAEEFLEADSRLAAAGYAHYEVSNYARDGKRSRHNSAYWSGAEYLGVGPSAHSLIGDERRWNVRAYEGWRARLLAGKSAVEGSELLTEEARGLESIYLGLRTSGGFMPRSSDAERVKRWVDAGWGHMDGATVRLNAAGWLRLDALAADLRGNAPGGNYITSHGSPAA